MQLIVVFVGKLQDNSEGFELFAPIWLVQHQRDIAAVAAFVMEIIIGKSMRATDRPPFYVVAWLVAMPASSLYFFYFDGSNPAVLTVAMCHTCTWKLNPNVQMTNIFSSTDPDCFFFSFKKM